MKIHTLKTWPEYFEEIFNGNKNFDIRENDKDFKIGDRLDLMEYDPKTKDFTGRHCHRFITYIMKDNPFLNLENKVILSIK